MSLILTQSDSTPGSNPASYVNRFKNTFQIKANAEIAVQEVVLNRMGRFVVHQGARVFIRHGADDFHTPLRVSLAAGTYTPDELATHMEAQLNAYDSHPQFQGGWKCNSVYNGVVFQSFNIHVEQKVKVAASGPPTSTDVKTLNATYTEATGELLTSHTSYGQISMNPPISANTGELVVSFTETDVKKKLVIQLNTDAIVNTSSNTKNTMFLLYLDVTSDQLTVAQHNPKRNLVETLQVYNGFFANGHTSIKLKLEGEQLSAFVGTAADDENTPLYAPSRTSTARYMPSSPKS